jgi:hypothetical protein
MSIRNCIHCCYALILLWLTPEAAPAGELKIEVVPATTEVKIGDPLLLKVRVTNVSQDAIKLPDRISSGNDTLHFEVRGPSHTDYERVITTTSVGLRGSFRWDHILMTRATVVSCEAVFKADVDAFVFSMPGTYRIRAQVGASETALGFSPAVEIVVLPRRDGDVDPEGRLPSLIYDALESGGGSRTKQATVYETEAAKLESSQLKSILVWMGAIARLRDAKDRSEQKLARAAFDDLRGKADAVTRDRMTLTLAEVLIGAKAYQAAIAELDEIKEDNTQKAEWLYVIPDRQRDEEAAKKARQGQAK